MLDLVLLAVAVMMGQWFFAGAIAALCALEFGGVRPSRVKLAAAILAGPLAINSEAWGIKKNS